MIYWPPGVIRVVNCSKNGKQMPRCARDDGLAYVPGGGEDTDIPSPLIDTNIDEGKFNLVWFP
jgi:hypothetical protein